MARTERITGMAIATIIQYDDNGDATAKPERLSLHYCMNDNPPCFEISLPDKGRHHRSIKIRASTIKRMLEKRA